MAIVYCRLSNSSPCYCLFFELLILFIVILICLLSLILNRIQRLAFVHHNKETILPTRVYLAEAPAHHSPDRQNPLRLYISAHSQKFGSSAKF